jgi:hypothetical protein
MISQKENIMKLPHSKLLSLIISSTFVFSLQAGEKGNGGYGIICKKSNNEIEAVRFYDLWEEEQEYIELQNLDSYQKIFEERLLEIAPSWGKSFNKVFTFYRNELIHGKNKPKGSSLAATLDFNPEFTPDICPIDGLEKSHLVSLSPLMSTNGIKTAIDLMSIKRLPLKDLSALLLHETLSHFLREEKSTTTPILNNKEEMTFIRVMTRELLKTYFTATDSLRSLVKEMGLTYKAPYDAAWNIPAAHIFRTGHREALLKEVALNNTDNILNDIIFHSESSYESYPYFSILSAFLEKGEIDSYSFINEQFMRYHSVSFGKKLELLFRETSNQADNNYYDSQNLKEGRQLLKKIIKQNNYRAAIILLNSLHSYASYCETPPLQRCSLNEESLVFNFIQNIKSSTTLEAYKTWFSRLAKEQDNPFLMRALEYSTGRKKEYRYTKEKSGSTPLPLSIEANTDVSITPTSERSRINETVEVDLSPLHEIDEDNRMFVSLLRLNSKMRLNFPYSQYQNSDLLSLDKLSLTSVELSSQTSPPEEYESTGWFSLNLLEFGIHNLDNSFTPSHQNNLFFVEALSLAMNQRFSSNTNVQLQSSFGTFLDTPRFSSSKTKDDLLPYLTLSIEFNGTTDSLRDVVGLYLKVDGLAAVEEFTSLQTEEALVFYLSNKLKLGHDLKLKVGHKYTYLSSMPGSSSQHLANVGLMLNF